MIVLIYADGISNCCWIIIFYVIHISFIPKCFIPKCLFPKCFIPKCFIPKCLRILEYLSFEVTILKHSIIIYGPSLYNQYKHVKFYGRKIMTILRVFEFLAQGNNGGLWWNWTQDWQITSQDSTQCTTPHCHYDHIDTRFCLFLS